MINQVKYPEIGGLYDAEDLEAVSRLLSEVAAGQGGFFPQPEEANFQEAFARFEGMEFCAATTSCGTALDACLAVLGIGPGDEVITTPLTFVGTGSSILLRGAKLVLADIDAATLNLSPDAVRKRITPRTKCILPVHFAGLACDVHAFEQISAEYGIPVIYDSAHAIGVNVDGRPLASFGTASCYSFQFNKLMTCLGEGGAVIAPRQEFVEAIRQLRTFGFRYPRKDTYDGGEVVSVGTNYQMNRIQYAVGITQVRKLAMVLAKRQRLYRRYASLLQDIDGLVLPQAQSPSHGCLHYIVRPDRRVCGVGGRELASVLARYGVETRHHYPPLWKWQAMRDAGVGAEACPVAEEVCDELVTLPLGPRVTEDECAYVAQALSDLLTS